MRMLPVDRIIRALDTYLAKIRHSMLNSLPFDSFYVVLVAEFWQWQMKRHIVEALGIDLLTQDESFVQTTKPSTGTHDINHNRQNQTIRR